MTKITPKNGLIIFTHNKFKIMRPMSLVSGIINFLQTGRLSNPDHKPTHTAQTIIIFDKLYVIDSDNDGLEPELWESWKKGRAWVHVYDPAVVTEEMERIYVDRALAMSGQRYGFEDLAPEIVYILTGRFKGERRPDKADDSMICSVTTAYLFNYNNWWKRYPLDLFENRFKDAPNGKDLAMGKPEGIGFN